MNTKINYKYTLSKYEAGGRNRYTCPQCGQRKCFARYVDTDTNKPLDPSVGKCDHVNRCGYHYTPADYFRDHPDRKVPDRRETTHAARPLPQPQPTPLCTLDPALVSRSLSPRSQFVGWLQTRFPDKAEAIQRTLTDYRLGATRDGGVIFWQIDRQGRVRTGKIMHYGPDGHRTGNPNWTHALLQRQGLHARRSASSRTRFSAQGGLRSRRRHASHPGRESPAEPSGTALGADAAGRSRLGSLGASLRLDPGQRRGRLPLLIRL